MKKFLGKAPETKNEITFYRHARTCLSCHVIGEACASGDELAKSVVTDRGGTVKHVRGDMDIILEIRYAYYTKQGPLRQNSRTYRRSRSNT
jgi:hypothetical protein